jgi:hypothetical protein
MLRRLRSFGNFGLMGLFALGLAVTAGSGCVVRETTVARPGACRGGVWVEGRYDRWGRWHPAHWRCPGERIEIY